MCTLWLITQIKMPQNFSSKMPKKTISNSSVGIS